MLTSVILRRTVYIIFHKHLQMRCSNMDHTPWDMFMHHDVTPVHAIFAYVRCMLYLRMFGACYICVCSVHAIFAYVSYIQMSLHLSYLDARTVA